ncbi:phenylalanine--tRNA ligase subunit beta [Nakamurella endophytica]|uniref:Phenylalanine--tRNA ligase beta subunit n=1 Tax=Nakamurella endophytica TaxID=1748367 RepID=A0A917WLG0_9ACTN|nr:phenylalanine--tRNA ligase subunit beta [Nakamurella endophytica]GGM13609.1 phenylalanine--tRNA ligase beta subunit [Nakamurella endophytica]
MRAPLSWLAEDVDLPAGTTAQQVADALLRVGFETEGVHIPPATEGLLVVGVVRTIEELTGFKKPIRWCTVDVGPGNGPDGGDAPRGIICGARNFAVGDHVVVALPGTVLPGGFEIASRQTYGHVSDGMICSVRELGIGTEHEGILVLDPDAPVGADARGLIGADDGVVELAVTPDRGYALSIRGLARETGAALDVPFRDEAAARSAALPAREHPAWPVTVEDEQGCARFVAVRVQGVDPSAPSPWWLRRRVQAAGIRSISLAVDITNYVMVGWGQPLHAFDAGRLRGGITVRRARPGETLRTLDGTVRRLAGDDLVVADESGAVSLAGVMGGESTEISGSTDDVLLEAAWWDPAAISRTARRHKLPSEASRRFERAVDPAVAAAAAEYAAELLVRYGGGEITGRTDVGRVPVLPSVQLPLSEPERLTGRSYEPAVIAHRLEQLGAVVTSAGRSLTVLPPSWRPDLSRPADLVEEVARVDGYDDLPSVLPAAPPGTGLTAEQQRHRRIAADLASAGLTEVLSFPFVGSADLDRLGLPAGDARRRSATLSNPLDADRPAMATTLLPGLIDAAVRNLSRGARDLALFEIAQVVLPRADQPAPPALPVDRRPTDAELRRLSSSLPLQPQHVAAVLCGDVDPAGWWGPGRAASWGDAVELARRVGAVAGVELRVTAASVAPWHPGRCARISVGDWPVGYAGELHPAVCERYGLPPRSCALELDLDALPLPAPPRGPRISPFPPVRLDVAVVVPAAVPAGDVTAALRDGGGPLLESVRLFDVYTGDQVPEGSVSLAFALVVRAPDRTLTAAEAVQVRDAAVAAAQDRTGATLR